VDGGLLQVISRKLLSVTPAIARAILVAAVFELLVYVVNRRIRSGLAAALRRDSGREPSERIRRRRIVEGLPLLASRLTLYAIAFLMILRIFGLRTEAELLPILLALALIAALVFRDHLREAARGYYILYDHLYGPGDRVTIGELTGLVTDLGLRTTRLRMSDGQEIVIPNSQVRGVINHSRQAPPERERPEGQ
jgi:small-conductance mechanosensitive channel